MNLIEQIRQEEKCLPYWHYEGLTGIPAWYSEEHEEVIKDRIKRVTKANDIAGNTMKYCHCCEVGIGVMNHSTYELVYIALEEKCPTCGNKAFNPSGIWYSEE